MTKEQAEKLSEYFWSVIGDNNTWYDKDIDDLEVLLNKVQQFQDRLPKAFLDIDTDCTAQKTLIITRQNYLATGKYLNDAI